MAGQVWQWVGFNVFVLAMLALDLFVLHKDAHAVRFREAIRWAIIWVLLAVIFGAGVWYFQGAEQGLAFFTGYLIEEALSVDNIFVFVLVFSYFRVPPQYQHRVLFWGVLGALVMRGIMIAVGAALIARFHWIIYVFGAFLVVTGIRMAFHDESDIEPESNPVLRLVRRLIPIAPHYDGQKFFTRDARTGRRFATPLLVVLVIIETTDLVFALDSIPAIFSVTRDPFIVYTSNIFAILGLRTLYFLLAGIIHRFHYLKIGLSVVLVFIGVKMLVEHWIEIPIAASLGIVAAVLGASVVASLIWPSEAKKHDPVEFDPIPGDFDDPNAPPPAPEKTDRPA
jgi:tellurite resistance protein TerC